MSNIDSLKNRIEELANQSINFNQEIIDGIHPIVLVDSVKSIISLDFENPSSKLLDWLEKDILTSSSGDGNLNHNHKVTNASFKELKEALINNQKDEIDNLLINFSMLTEGTQLVEFFLEMSLYQSGVSFINIWRSFKLFKFTKIDNKVSFYRLLSHFILADQFRDNICSDEVDKTIEKINDSYFDIVLFSNFSDCSELNCIREKSVGEALKSMAHHIKDQVKTNRYISISYDRKQKNRLDILDLINNQDFVFSQMNILLLDSIRMLIRNNECIGSLFLDNIYNKLDNCDL